MAIKRGEVYFVELDPVVGHEIGGNKKRPVIVLSINDINEKPLVVSVVPGTKATAKTKPFRNVVNVEPSSNNGLSVKTVFQCHQVRAIDHSRFSARASGHLRSSELRLIEEAVKFSLGLP